MKFKELEIFYELSEDTHVSKLAQKLQMSQSAISLSIKSLENKLGETLFDRVGKKLILNERGEVFRDNTYKQFVSLKHAKDLFKKDKIKGRLQVSASRTIGDYILPQIIFDFLKDFPKVAVASSIYNSKKIAQMVVEGSISIGFIEAIIYKKDLISQKIGGDELIIVSKDKILSEKSHYIDELFDKIWLLREEGSGTRDMFLNTLGNISYDIDNFLELSSFESIKSLLLKNKEAITCISKICVEDELRRGELFEIKLKNIEFKRDFFLIYHKNKYKNRLFTTFEEFSLKYFIDT